MHKVAFITGASRGIGRSTAIAFAKAGFHVAITAREFDNDKLQRNKITHSNYAVGSLLDTVRVIKTIGVEVLAIKMDLLSPSSVHTAVEQTLSHFGVVDVLVNNAIYQGPDLNVPLLDLTPDTLDKVSKAYIFAPVQISQMLIPKMLEQQSGCIINITSGAGEKDPPIAAIDGGWGYAYGAGKAAVSRLSGIINIEHGKQGIRAFTVNPGVVNTETLRVTLGNRGIKALGQAVVEPEIIADILLWIATHKEADKLQCRTINAQQLAIDIEMCR
ncbi:MAG: SDR family NAD(P)-dependent oxidoreductase [Glaciecola sp.]|nr:SDR family NAD(P)-dependent oxidoreductase [Glaciecola sp.]MDG1814556.1 SDR family NAD(P)-dependent oxidoreductase [Glaciecola sp.]MDG2099512.1 SDR family NAD(P)-dependent oxidoreductase [Glaciecola sp.]